MSKRRRTLELFQVMIDQINKSGETEFVKSDFRHPPLNIKPDSILELWKIAQLVQNEMPPIKEILEIRGKHYLRLKSDE